MNDLNQEFVNAFGVEFDWRKYIAAITVTRATGFVGTAIFDDILTDVFSNLWLAAHDGKLDEALDKAKENA